MAQEPFLWGRAGRKLTPDQVAKERETASLLAKGAMDYSPVGHWSQGLNRVAQGLLAGLDYRAADKAESEIADVNKGIISSLLGGTSTPAASIPMTGAAGEVSATSPGMQQYRDAIAGIESAGSGDYSAVGPTNDKLGRALGRYQIMEANIGPWSQEALGRAVTPEEFIANPEIQDAIFDKKFGSYVQQFGPEGAAQAWFAGPGGVGKVGRQDVLGTTVGDYGKKFTSALGGSPAEVAIEEVAPLDPPREVATMPVASVPAQQPVQMAGGGGRPSGINPAIIEALTNPQATPQTQRLAGILLEQEQRRQEASQEEQNWRARQQYEQELLSQDPLRQAQIQKLQREAQNPNGDETFFGNAVPYKDAQGNIRMGQLGNRGTFRPVPLEEGASFAPTTRSVDTGTEILTIGPGGEILDRVPKQNREEAAEKAFGSTEGKAQAETRGEYESITSKMPGLYGVVDRLDKLAETATYTMVGQGVDWLRNQTGLGPRQGAIDRAEYTAVVDNQILPLLKDTFGAQFTAEEGQRLARTLGDPDKSPVEKQALLRAFIQQKERDIQALGSRIGESPDARRGAMPQGGNEVQTDIPGVKIRRKN